MKWRSYASGVIGSSIGVLFALLLLPSLAIGGEIHQAAETGDVQRLEQLLASDPDLVNARDAYDDTPLHLAVGQGQLDAARVLLTHGADIEASDQDGRTPLHRAADRGRPKAVELLLESGATPDARDWDRATALHLAARAERADEVSLQEVMRILIDYGATVDIAQEDGETPLHQAAVSGHAGRAAILLSAGAWPNARTNDGLTPLHMAAYVGSLDVISGLIEHGAEPDAAAARSGASPLLMALSRRQNEAVQRLLELGANVEFRARDGTSPLLAAVETDNQSAGNLLLKFGADIEGINQFTSDTPLIAAAGWGQFGMVQWLIEKGATLSAKRRNGETALHAAAREGRLDVIELLLQYGINVNEPSATGETPLHAAAAAGQTEAARILIGHKADAKLRDSDGDTPLHWAASLADIGAVRLLLLAGADVDSRNDLGFSAFDLASRRSSKTSPELLGLLAAPESPKALTLVGGLGDPARLQFSGNSVFSADQLRSGLLSDVDFLVASYAVSPLSVYLKVLETRLLAGYLAAGFPDAKVAAKMASNDHNIQVEIDEGPRFTQGGVKVTGARTIPVERFVQRLTAVESPTRKEAGSARSGTGLNANAFPVWYPGMPAPFDTRAHGRLAVAIEHSLLDFGYAQTKLSVEIVADPAKGTADLIVHIIDEGPRTPIERVDIFGNARNTRKAILDYLALDPDAADDPESLRRIEFTLVDSGRFLQASATVEWTSVPSKTSKRILVIRVVESQFGPTLDEQMTPNEAVASKICDWLGKAQSRGDGYVFDLLDWSDQRLAQLAVDPNSLALVVQNYDVPDSAGIAFALLVSGDSVRLYDKRTGLNVLLPLPMGYTAHIDLRGSELTFGFNFQGGRAFKRSAAKSRLAVEKSACFRFAQYLPKDVDLAAPAVTAELGDLKVSFDPATGRPLEALAAVSAADFPGLPAEAVSLRVRVEPNAVERSAARIKVNIPAVVDGRTWLQDLPLVLNTFIDILMTRDPYASALFPDASADTRARGAYALQRILTGDAMQKLATTLKQAFVPLDGKGTFRIPARDLPESQTLESSIPADVGALVQGLTYTLVPPDSWPLTLSRLVALVHGGKALYVGPEIDRALADQKTGPIGYLISAKAMRRIHSPYYRDFAQRGLEQLTTEGFHRDSQFLLDQNWPFGQFVAQIGDAIRDLPGDDVDALVEVLPIGARETLQNGLAVLRSSERSEPLDKLLQPALDALWDGGLRRWIETGLDDLAKERVN